MTFLSLFAGIGGFDLGFERAGLECVGQVEIDEKCNEVLAKHWPEVKRYGDIERFDAKQFRGVDVVCGGFPCQDLSVAGKRKGLAGGRSGLFWEALRVCDEARPQCVVIENVPGLLSSQDGRDMETVVRGLVELGYRVCWRVLDSEYFGVAQRRYRVFLVGSLGDGRCAEILFESESLRGDSPPSREAGTRVAAGLTAGSHPGSNAPGRRREDDVNLVARPLLGKPNYSHRADMETYVASPITASAGHHGHSSPRGDGSDNLVMVRTAQAGSNGWGVSDSAYCLDGAQGQAVAFSNRGKPTGDVGETLRSDCHGAEPVVMHRSTVRRLTPTECARLQGFPDDWNKWLSDSTRYKQFGNAVTVSVAEWIGRRLLTQCS